MGRSDGFFDAAEGVQQFADGEVESGVGGLAAHQVGDGQGEHAVEDVHPDLLLGPVEHRGERDHVAVFELAEAGFGVGLGAVGGDHLGYGPVVAVGEQDPFAEDLRLPAPGGPGRRCLPGQPHGGGAGRR